MSEPAADFSYRTALIDDTGAGISASLAGSLSAPGVRDAFVRRVERVRVALAAGGAALK